MHRPLTAAEAESVHAILVSHAGARGDADERYSFVHAVTRTDGHHAIEYRFGGLLGFGGKFRNNGNRDGMPYVDCYTEDSNPMRDGVIATTNALLEDMFRDMDLSRRLI